MVADREVTLPTSLNLEKCMEFVEVCNASKCDIFFSKDQMRVNGKGILGVVTFMLNLKEGESIGIQAKGTDSDKVLDHLSELLSSN
ncbi:HPr family phosphocarrier protein [Paenibacillus sp. P26]|nr:HPr family phosphocarrier protein [Paenibacillus sp. P26]UUZ95461.1 HPr family phosphocarrier protein [Paenibacillus sp. P25]